jgi:signal transduction histidine kinase/CheY-like chemotaxis protein
VVPVVADGELWGFLGFDDCTGTLPWSQGEHAILNTLASSLGAALSRNKNEESLRIAKNKAEESDRLKTKFLQNISHEIRTPMNAISGFVGFMKDPEVDSDEKEVFMDIIEKSVQQLLSTINNIVEISIIDAGLQSPSQLDFGIADMMNQIIDEHEKQAHRKHIDLKINYRLPETIQSIITDPKYLQSILYNLTDNAIKYTKSGGVELGVYLHDNDIVFYVQDTGIGIAENQLDIIFQRFEHGEGHKEKAREGSGLGLAVAKAYVQALGGKIWVQSELGVGSTFYVKIPFVTLSKAIGKTPWPEHEEPLIIPEKTILIVEDQIINYYVLELMLRENKCKVLLAKSGEEAVSITKSNDNISLILMDVKMGGIDGYQATRLIRQFNTTVPIIAQTAHVYTQDKEKAINSGCDDFIAKPIHRGILQRMLRRYLI